MTISEVMLSIQEAIVCNSLICQDPYDCRCSHSPFNHKITLTIENSFSIDSSYETEYCESIVEWLKCYSIYQVIDIHIDIDESMTLVIVKVQIALCTRKATNLGIELSYMQ